MTKTINQAAREWTDVACRPHVSMTTGQVGLIEDAFKAGAEWERDHLGDDQAARNYRNLMAMLEQINKTTVETKDESHTRLGAFHQIMERIEGKVGAVLDTLQETENHPAPTTDWPATYEKIMQREPVTDESGVSTGAGAGPLKDERDVRIRELEFLLSDALSGKERAERFWRFWRGIARARGEQNAEMGGMIDELINLPPKA